MRRNPEASSELWPLGPFELALSGLLLFSLCPLC